MYLEPGRDDLGRLRHLILTGKNNAQELDLYLAEHDEKGKPKRWLFDSFFLFPPVSSGNSLGADVNIGTTMSGEGDFYAVPCPNPGNLHDWLEAFDQYYRQGGMLDILQQEATRLTAKLGKPPHPINVVLLMNYPSPIQSRFGVVNGKKLNFSVKGQNLDKASRDRLEACQWYATNLAKAWDKKRFSALNLLGFYWPFETVYRSWDVDDHWVLKEFRGHVNSLGKKMFWIPFWCSYNVHLLDDYENYYFDAAFLQPNYMFYENLTSVGDAAEAAHKRHAGIEMEFYENTGNLNFRPRVIKERIKRFRAYLDGGVRYEYMKKSALAWYMGGKVFFQLYQSKKKKDQELYRDICAFIHGEYKPPA